jgi:hypothetical protein
VSSPSTSPLHVPRNPFRKRSRKTKTRWMKTSSFLFHGVNFRRASPANQVASARDSCSVK